MAIYLTNVEDRRQRYRFSEEQCPILFGRDACATVKLDDPRVALLHCLLDIKRGTLFLRDLATPNGTYVNGQRLKAGRVMPGDCLTLGRTCLRVDYRGRESGHWTAG